VLSVKLGTVRSRIHRGRAQLRAALEHRRPRRVGAAEEDIGAAGPAGSAGAVEPVPITADAALLGEVS